MTPKRMNTTLKILLVLLFITVSVGLFFANKYLTAMASDTAQLKAQIEVDQKRLTIYERTKVAIQDLSYVDELAAEVLPASEDQSVIIAEVSQFAKRSNLGVAKITFDVTQTAKPSSTTKKSTTSTIPKGVNITPITIQLAEGASYKDLLDFLVRLEENRRRMQVVDISLAPNAEDRSKLQEVIISINLYTQAPKTEEKK